MNCFVSGDTVSPYTIERMYRTSLGQCDGVLDISRQQILVTWQIAACICLLYVQFVI